MIKIILKQIEHESARRKKHVKEKAGEFQISFDFAITRFSFFRAVWRYPLSQKIHRVSDSIQSIVRIMLNCTHIFDSSDLYYC